MPIASSNFIADGRPFRVNTEVAGSQRLSQVTDLGNGTFYVTWTSTDQDGDRYGVYGQMFDVDGNPIGPETQINTYTNLDQTLPQITTYGDGNFVIVWQSFAQDETVYESYPDNYWSQYYAVGLQYGVYGQSFDSTGQPIGDEFLVNTTTRDNQHIPEVLSLPDGGYVVIWLNWFYELTYLGEPHGSYRMQRYDADGNPVAGEVVLDTYPPVEDNYNGTVGTYPEFTITNDGRIIAIWNTPSTDYPYQLYLREFDLDGTPLTDRIPVLELSHMAVVNSSIAALPDGGYVISVVHHVGNSSGSNTAVYARIYDVNGVPRGDEFRVSDNDSSFNNFSRVVALPDGGFVIAWAENGIRARVFDSNGVPIGPEVLLSNDNFGRNGVVGHHDFDLAVLDDGRIILTTNGFDPFEPNGDSTEVIAQIFEITGFGITTLFSNGSDTVTLPDQNNNVSALDGNDTISGGNLEDIIRGQNGADTIYGGDGDDRIFGGDGADILNGDAGADFVAGGLGNDTIDGGAGDDDLYGDEGDDLIRGGDGDDYLESGLGADTLWGGDGNDVLIGRASNGSYSSGNTYTFDILYGGAGNDYLRGHYGDDHLYGGDGDDVLAGGWGDDYLEGGLGNDQLFGGGGNDQIYGGAGNDRLVGGGGVDELIGGEGDDEIHVGFDGSTALGGAGNDTIFVTPSVNGVVGQIIDGGTGVNTLGFSNYSDSARVVWVDMSQSFIAFRTDFGYADSFEQAYVNFTNVTVTGNYAAIIIGDDSANHIINAGTVWRYVSGAGSAIEQFGGRVSAGGGDDLVEGGVGHDDLSGDAGNDTIFGYAGDDTISGGDGDDHLYGGSGSDTIIAGQGSNILNGDGAVDGSGRLGSFADEFVFRSLDSTNLIEDFEAGIDTINLSSFMGAAGSVTFNLNDMTFSRMNCFEEINISTIGLNAVQQGADAVIYLSYYTTGGDAFKYIPFITLSDVDISTLSMDDFIL